VIKNADGIIKYGSEMIEGPFDKGEAVSCDFESGYSFYRTESSQDSVWYDLPWSDYLMRNEGGICAPYILNTGSIYISTIEIMDGDSVKIAPFNTSFLGATEFIEFRIGHFNDDKILDFAYTYEKPGSGIFTRIFESEPIWDLLGVDKCFGDDSVGEEMRVSVAWHFGQVLARYFRDNDGIDSGKMDLMKRAAGAICQFDNPSTANHMAQVMAELADRDKSSPEIFAKKMRELVELGMRLWDEKPAAVWDLDFEKCRELMSGIFDEVKVPEKARIAVSLFNGILYSFEKSKYEIFRDNVADVERLQKALIAVGNRLSANELMVLHYMVSPQFDDYSDYEDEIERLFESGIHDFVKDLESVLAADSNGTLYQRVFSLFDWHGEINLHELSDLGKVLMVPNKPKIKDVRAAHKTITPEEAKLLYEKFGISRFGRYHESVLTQMVALSRDKDHDRHKPLVVSVVAKDDRNGMFYWGRIFRQDPRVRVIVVEVDSKQEFVDRMKEVVGEYGIPDSLMITAHGKKSDADFINVEDEKFIKESIGTLFGNRTPQVVLNSCSTGSDHGKRLNLVFDETDPRYSKDVYVDDERINVAQMMANALNTVVQAPEAIAGLMKLYVEFDPTGRARLHPVWAEVKDGPLAINDGGRIFVPQPEGVITPRDYGGYGTGEPEDRSADSNPINADLPDLRQGARKLFRSIFGN
jgi:hypothetical protein